MKPERRVRYLSLAIVASAALAATLAGCGAPATTSADAGALPISLRGRTWSPAKAPNHILFVGDRVDSEIFLYDSDHPEKKPFQEILQGIACPGAVKVDTVGTLYVDDQCGESITEYPLGATTPSFTIPRSKGDTGLTVDAQGNVFVGSENDNSINVYAPGQTTSFATLTGCFNPGPFATDPHGRVWVECGGTLDYIEPGSLELTKSNIGAGDIVGISFDKTSTMYVTIFDGNPSVYVFPPGKTQPSKSFGRNITQPSDNVVAAGGEFFLATNVGPVFAFDLSDYKRFAQFRAPGPSGIAAWPSVVK
jgi:hypothetical protein